MIEKLKPCPFCGANEPDIEEDTIHCLGCGVIVSGWDGCDGHLGAPEIWNNRPTEKAARKEVLELAINELNILGGHVSVAAGGLLGDARNKIRQAHQKRFGA